MADLDAELLALAGEESSDEEIAKPTIAKDGSPNSADGSPSNAASNSRATPKKVKRAKPRKSTRRDDSEEEGEA